MSFGRIHISFCLIFSFAIPLVGLTACQTDPQIRGNKPAFLLRQANRLSRNKDYFRAAELYKQILEDYPDSPERVEAQLFLADTLMKKKEYGDAKLNYESFIELYPAWSNVDHAYFYLAMADYMMIDIALRDQTFTRSALAQFEQLIRNFPKSSYLKRAEKKIRECRKKLAENILEISRFYFRTHSYQSAINRLKSLLATYPKQKFNDEVMFLLAESYYNEQNYREAQLLYNQLLDQYPNSSFIREALLRLKVLR
ncbi:MAG: outer membrane protein assembly factor BamD [Nitrospinota bacterium]|nr:outer membrane protein assembly factor BamD [Nitrospinota bacterium]